MSVKQQANVFDLSDKHAATLSRWFTFSAACIFLITGSAKMVSICGTQAILDVSDPIFGISFRTLLLCVGLVEIAVSAFCFLLANKTACLALVIWIAVNFLLYRIGLVIAGWHRPCPCLGNITQFIHISPATAELFTKLSLAYLFIGSSAFLMRKSIKGFK
jgi:hypothetical protein